MKYRIVLHRQTMGIVEIADVLTTDPKAEAFRKGLIQRGDIHLCHAWPITEESESDEDANG